MSDDEIIFCWKIVQFMFVPTASTQIVIGYMISLGAIWWGTRESVPPPLFLTGVT